MGGIITIELITKEQQAMHHTPTSKSLKLRPAHLLFKSERPREIRVLLQLLVSKSFQFPRHVMVTICPNIFTLLWKFMVIA